MAIDSDQLPVKQRANGYPMDKSATRPPAVIANMSYSGLALARSLARRGIKVYGVAPSMEVVGMTSRYITPVVIPNIIRSDQDTVEALLKLGDDIGQPAILFPTGDALVLPLSKHRERLKEAYRFLVPSVELAESLVSKEGLAEIVERLNYPGPKSWVINDPSQLNEVAASLEYPVILKPVYSASWYLDEMTALIGHRKVIEIDSESDLRHWYELVAQVDGRVILQEFIPGDDNTLYYTCGYFNSEGELEAIFAGQKLRITPVHYGSASFVRSVYDKKLVQATVDLLKPLGYKGLFGVEFKKDDRDGQYKIIEVNVRWGLWDGLAARCGIDIAFLAYARETGLPYQVAETYRTNIKWLSLRRDLDAFIDYHREGLLSLPAWLWSLLGEKEHAVFAWDDPRPGLVELKAIVSEKLRGLLSRIKK